MQKSCIRRCVRFPQAELCNLYISLSLSLHLPVSPLLFLPSGSAASRGPTDVCLCHRGHHREVRSQPCTQSRLGVYIVCVRFICREHLAYEARLYSEMHLCSADKVVGGRPKSRRADTHLLSYHVTVLRNTCVIVKQS